MAKLTMIIEFSDTLRYKVNSMAFLAKTLALIAILAEHSCIRESVSYTHLTLPTKRIV